MSALYSVVTSAIRVGGGPGGSRGTCSDSAAGLKGCTPHRGAPGQVGQPDRLQWEGSGACEQRLKRLGSGYSRVTRLIRARGAQQVKWWTWQTPAGFRSRSPTSGTGRCAARAVGWTAGCSSIPRESAARPDPGGRPRPSRSVRAAPSWRSAVHTPSPCTSPTGCGAGSRSPNATSSCAARIARSARSVRCHPGPTWHRGAQGGDDPHESLVQHDREPDVRFGL